MVGATGKYPYRLVERFIGRTYQKLLPGKTIAPVIIATDKTKLAQFGTEKAAHPVYLTLGNIPRHIRRKPSRHACVLIGYLPTAKPNHTNVSELEHRSRTSRLFHDAMRIILEPLNAATKKRGEAIVCGDGQARSVLPILATYVADYPEQCLVSCAKSGTCPRCKIPDWDIANLAKTYPDRSPKDTLHIIDRAKKTSRSNKAFYDECTLQDLGSGVLRPFWEGFVYVDINLSITSDVLHQLHQGVLKYLISWVQGCMSSNELDARIRSLPPAYGVTHFHNGISSLGQVSGKVRKNMAKILLGCLIGSNRMHEKGIRAAKAILDFIYLAEYSSHDEVTLQLMVDALKEWREHRDWFITAGQRLDFDIPKFHSLTHYVQCIRDFGTTDNYNTDMFERLHIDFAKKGWRASNKRNEIPQMIKWLERQEKVAAIERMVELVKEKEKEKEDQRFKLEAERSLFVETVGASEEYQQQARKLVQQDKTRVILAKNPFVTHITDVEKALHCPTFTSSLLVFLSRISRRGPNKAKLVNLPFVRVELYNKFKLVQEKVDEEDEDTIYTVNAKPAQQDTVVVLANKSAESAGLQGLF